MTVLLLDVSNGESSLSCRFNLKRNFADYSMHPFVSTVDCGGGEQSLRRLEQRGRLNEEAKLNIYTVDWQRLNLLMSVVVLSDDFFLGEEKQQ